MLFSETPVSLLLASVGKLTANEFSVKLAKNRATRVGFDRISRAG
jgi:hypothetical protein